MRAVSVPEQASMMSDVQPEDGWQELDTFWILVSKQPGSMPPPANTAVMQQNWPGQSPAEVHARVSSAAHVGEH